MKLNNKNDFLKKSNEILEEIFDMMGNLPVLEMESLQENQTALVIVDMINGFVREGALKSPRVEAIIPEIVGLMRKCDAKDIAKLAFADCHTEASPEFGAYPVHCMKGNSESEVIDEIKEVGGFTLIEKNSTNGFIEDDFLKWRDENNQIDTFIVTGDCTDICVQQFAITLKTWFNMLNKKARIIVPINAVETYDLGMHNGDLVNVMALYNMFINGIELVKEVK